MAADPWDAILGVQERNPARTTADNGGISDPWDAILAEPDPQPPVNDSQIDSQPIHSDAAGFASQPTPWAVSPNPVVERAPVVAGLPPTDPAAYSAYQRQQAGNRAGLAADAAAQQAITKGVPYAGRLLAGVAGAAGSRINEAAGSWRDVLRFYTGGEATGQPAGVVDPRAVDELNAMGGTVGDTVGRGIIQNAPAVAELVPIDPVGMASMFLSHPLAKAAKSMEAFAAARTQFLTELETVAGRRAAALTGNAIDDAVGGAAFGGVNAGARGENPITGAIEGGAAGAALGGVIRGVGAVAGKMRGTPSETRIIPPEYPSGVIQSAVNEMRPGAVDARSLNAQEVKAETNIGKTGPKVQTNSEAGAAAGSVGVERQGHPGDKVGDALGAVDRPSLESLAAELGVPFTRRTRDVDLRRAVEAATSRLAGVGTPLPTVTAAAPRADGSPPAEGAAYRGAAGSDSSLTPSPAEAEAASNRAGGDTTVSGAQPGKSGTRGSMDARMRSASGEPSGLPLLGSEPPAASPEAAAYPQGTKGTGSRFPDQTESQAPKGMRQADPGMPESLPGDAPPYPRAKSTTGEEGSSRSDSARSQAVEAVPSPNPTPREPVAKTVPPSTPPPVESRSTGAPGAPGAMPVPAEGTPKAATKRTTPLNNKAGTPRAFSKADLERRIVAEYQKFGVDLQTDTTIEEAANQGGGKATTFYKRLPGEVKSYLQGRPHMRNRFNVTNDPSRAGGDDVMRELGDKYFEMLDQRSTGLVRRAKEYVKYSGDPQTKFLVALHDNLPEGRQTPKDPTAPADIPTGSTFKINNERFRVVEGEDGYRVLRDGDKYPEVPVEALDVVPIDKGTLKKGKKPVELSETARTLTGEVDDSAITGRKTKPLFEDPYIDEGLPNPFRPKDTPEEAKMRAQYDENATPGMFEGDDAAPFQQASQLSGLNAKWRNNGVPRVEPDPIKPAAGAKPKSLGDIQLDLEKGLGLSVRAGKTSRGAAGTYYPGSAKTIIKFSGDMNTMAHEVAHRLDDVYSIVGAWANPRVRSPFDAELIPTFSQHGSSRSSGPRSTLQYMRAEGVAEWVRAYIVNPAEARRLAPRFAAHFEATVPADVRARLDAFGTDVRTFAGAPAIDKVMANVQWDKAEPGLGEKVKEFVRRARPGEFKLSIADQLTAVARDSLDPVWKAVEFARDLRGITDVLPENDARTLGRLFSGVESKADDIMRNGPLDAKNKRLKDVGGVPWIMEPLDQATPATIEHEMRLTAAYMIAERTIEQGLNKPGMAQRISGIGGGLESDMAVAVKAIGDITDPAQRARIEESARRYRAFADGLLAYARDKGRISAQQYKQITEGNQFYIAFNRAMDQIGDGQKARAGLRRIASKRDVTKKLTGSTRMIENPFVSLMEQAGRITKEADRNEVLQKVREDLTQARKMYQGDMLDLDQIGSLAKQGDADTTTIFVDGKAEHWQFNPDIHRALRDWGDVSATSLPVKVLEGMARVVRNGIVRWPGYIIRQQFRDPINRAIISESGSKPWDHLKYFLPGSGPARDAILSEFKRNGGALFGNYVPVRAEYGRQLDKHVNTLAKGGKTILSTMQDFGGKFNAASEFAGETVSRVAEYRRAFGKFKAKGLDDFNAGLAAAAEARDMSDYAVAGRWIRQLNRFIPFTNAAVQSLGRTIRTARGNPGGFALRWAMYAAAPTVATYAWNAYRGDLDEYRQLPAWRRDFFWNFKVGADTWVTIPKPFEMGVMATGVERAIDLAMGNKEAMSGFGGSLAKSMMPAEAEQIISGPMKPLIEAMANKDFYRNSEIVPDYEEDLDLSLRKGTESASRVGKLGQKMLGVDARKIDHVIAGTFGSTGRGVLSLLDLGREDKAGTLRRLAMSLSGITTSSPGSESIAVQKLLVDMRRAGLQGSREYKDFSGLRQAIAQAKDAQERDQLKRILRECATDLRTAMGDQLEETIRIKAEAMHAEPDRTAGK